jgi:hypothetical protein
VVWQRPGLGIGSSTIPEPSGASDRETTQRGARMTKYRICFSVGGRLGGRHDFEADDDVAAIRVARVLFDGCSDVSQSFELWQGRRRLPANQPHHSRASLADLIEAHQRLTIETEEAISRSNCTIARSKRLIETLDRAKAKNPSSRLTGRG